MSEWPTIRSKLCGCFARQNAAIRIPAVRARLGRGRRGRCNRLDQSAHARYERRLHRADDLRGKSRLGDLDTMQHVALEVSDIHQAYKTALARGAGRKSKPRISHNGKWAAQSLRPRRQQPNRRGSGREHARWSHPPTWPPIGIFYEFLLRAKKWIEIK